MADPLVLAAAGSAGAAVATGIAGLAAGPRRAAAEVWLERRRAPARSTVRSLSAPRPLRRLLARAGGAIGPDIKRAGWSETPERLFAGVALTTFAAGAMTAWAAMTLDLPAGSGLVLAAIACPPALWWRSLLAAGRRRRERLAAEAAPLLELLCLELGGGASLASGLESVATRLDGELVSDLRPLLVGARVSGGATLHERLDAYGDLHRLPALKSLAALCAMSRDYGSGAAQGARALAADIRREQRRRVIAISRRALNRVLIPSAVGILLPFIGVLLFPAAVTLLKNLS